MSFSLQNTGYDNPAFTVMRTESFQTAQVSNGVIPGVSFRSKLKAIVTNISVVMQSVASKTHLLTLLFNGSNAALLTLQKSANKTVATFTLTANRTMNDLTDRFEVSAAVADKGKMYFVFQYLIVPQDITCFGTNLI